MHFELYQKMLSYKLYPTYTISTIHNKTVDKRNSSIKRISLAKANQEALNNTNNLLSLNPFKKTESSFLNSVKKSISNFDCTNLLMDCDKTFSNIRKQQAEFRKRTIKSKLDPSCVISDKFRILETFPCVDCQMPLNLNEIGKDFKKMLKDLEWAKCPHCDSALLPKLRIKYFGSAENESFELNENYISNDFDEAEVLYSPFYLKYNFNNTSFIESRLKLDLDTFKMKYNAIFWNSIWYFDIKGLPYDFLMPYFTPPAAAEEVCFPAPSLFVQNIRLSYTKDKEASYSRLSFDECEPKFLINELLKSILFFKFLCNSKSFFDIIFFSFASNFFEFLFFIYFKIVYLLNNKANIETNEDSELTESFKMGSRLSTIRFDENRRQSFSGFLKRESAENIIYKALGINKNSSIEIKSTSQMLNESFIKYNSQEENETRINNVNDKNNNNFFNKSKIIDINEIDNSNMIIEIKSDNTKEEEIYASKKTEKINRSSNSVFNYSSSNIENEFYLEIENCNNNNLTSENKSNSKRICSFNSSFDKNSENNNSNFNPNEKGENNFILESPQRPRKNTVSHKSHTRLKSIFLNSVKGKSKYNNNDNNDKSQISIQDNKSEDQIDSNLKLKNLNNGNENENDVVISESVKLKSFKSSDDLNKVLLSGSVSNFNDAVLNTKIDFDYERGIENKDIVCFDASTLDFNLNSNLDRINRKDENENLISFDNLIEGKSSMQQNTINLLNKDKTNNHMKKKDTTNNNNNLSNKNNFIHEKKICILSEEKKYSSVENLANNNSDKNDENGNKDKENTEELIFETENALFNSNSKSFYKLRTIHEELESNYGSVNHSDNKNLKIDIITNSNNLENLENQKRKFSSRKNIIKFFEQIEFHDENIKINSEHLVSNKEEVKKFLLKKSKSLNNKIENKKSSKKVSFNENDENYEMVSSIGDLSKTQRLIKNNCEENDVPKFSL